MTRKSDKGPDHVNPYVRGERVVIEALSERSGKTLSNYPVHAAKRGDLKSLMRFVKISDGIGRSPLRTLERHLTGLGYLSRRISSTQGG